MEQQTETNEVLEELNKEKAEDRQPVSSEVKKMGQNREQEKEECHCIPCESGDRDVKEFYMVRIEGVIKTRQPPEEIRDQIIDLTLKGDKNR